MSGNKRKLIFACNYDQYKSYITRTKNKSNRFVQNIHALTGVNPKEWELVFLPGWKLNKRYLIYEINAKLKEAGFSIDE